MALMDRITVVGAGAWGTALAIAAHRAGRRVALMPRRPGQARELASTRRNDAYLPGVRLDPEIAIDASPERVADADAVLVTTPAQHLRAALDRLRPHWQDAALALCCKGIERSSGLLMPEIAGEILPGPPILVLSGPTFASEVARDLPAAVTVAGREEGSVRALMEAIGTSRFRPYASDDPIGAAVCGATKNVMAIACGIVAGRGLGENARAALVTRGLAEIQRLALAKGGRPETPMGLSGLGDLLLTCTSAQSRNYSLGAALGAGETLAGLMAGRRSVAEGVETAAAIGALAGRLGLDMPIAFAVDAILHRGGDIGGTIEQLLGRPFRTESNEKRSAD